MDPTNEHVEAMITPAEQLPATSRVIVYRQQQPNEFQADEGYGSYPASVQDDREVDYELENVQAQAPWTGFNKLMQTPPSARQYQRVAVLLMSLDEAADNLDARDEVTRFFSHKLL